jgi:hypothetical protein
MSYQSYRSFNQQERTALMVGINSVMKKLREADLIQPETQSPVEAIKDILSLLQQEKVESNRRCVKLKLRLIKERAKNRQH